MAGVAIGLFAAALGNAQPAWACRFGPPDELEIDETAASPELPSAPIVASVDIRRGGEEDGCGHDSCGNVGSVRLALEATDDTAPVGFRFALVEGELPDNFNLPRTPVRPSTFDDAITLHFVDEDPAPFYARIAVTAVDIAGNESAEITELELGDGQFEGCTAAGRAATGTILPVLLALGLVARKRRR